MEAREDPEVQEKRAEIDADKPLVEANVGLILDLDRKACMPCVGPSRNRRREDASGKADLLPHRHPSNDGKIDPLAVGAHGIVMVFIWAVVGSESVVAKAKTKLARLHRRVSDIRVDALHQLTTWLTRYRTIVIEDLNVVGMLANRNLARAIADVGFFEFRRQFQYKAAMAGSTIVVANRWFPSSKLCSACGAKNESLALTERTWTCVSCDTSHDRDVNAARNLARYAESSPASACGADGTGRAGNLAVKPAA